MTIYTCLVPPPAHKGEAATVFTSLWTERFRAVDTERDGLELDDWENEGGRGVAIDAAAVRAGMRAQQSKDVDT